ncbi:MAG: LacI family DNA-binding transcriptional regulator [Pseudomonadota bacterium]
MGSRKIKNMDEFAAVSGISRPTISKYFNDPESVRASTRERIEAAIQDYDYRPNIYAINQNRRLTKTVGVVVPYLADPFFTEIARKIERRCIEAGLSPILFSAHGEQALENDILDNLRSMKPAGVLLAPLGRMSDRGVIEKFCRDVPTILFDSNLDGIGEAFVGSDNFSFVSQSVEYLTRTGNPPVLFEMLYPANPNANKRRKAYVSMMERLGFEPKIFGADGHGWGFEEIGYREGLRFLKENQGQTDTVLCSNDRLAIGFLSACFERGIPVGRDENCALRVAAHDDHPFSRFTCPALTTVAHDYDQVSNKVIEMLFQLIESGGHFQSRSEHLYPAKLVLRSSA